MNKNIFLLSSVLMATTATAVRANEVPTTLARVNSSYIQKEDTTETAGNDHGVMLNAKDATEPRQAEIGLPMSYTAVTVDGLPAVFYYWPNTTSNHWRGEQLLASQGLQNISTTAIRFGEIGYGVDSYMERGGETFKGKLKYQTNTFGAQNFDINVSGKLATQAKKGVKLYWIAIGKEDQHMNNNKLLMERLDKDGLKYTYHESSRGHIWSNWRQYTLQFVPQLFK